jgi:hypothetical protein
VGRASDTMPLLPLINENMLCNEELYRRCDILDFTVLYVELNQIYERILSESTLKDTKQSIFAPVQAITDHISFYK